MKPFRIRCLSVVVVLAALGPWLLAATEVSPTPLSPGSPEGTRVAATCPTFSWSRLPESTDWELEVRRTSTDGASDEVVLSEALTAGTTSWTPPLDRCLERGGSYAWTLRPTGDRAHAEGPALRFTVLGRVSLEEFREAVETVRDHLGRIEATRQFEGWAGAARPSATAPLAGDPELRVTLAPGSVRINGNPAVTSKKTVFVTSLRYSASFGGASEADAFCAERAGAAGLAGVFKAWISDGVTTPAGSFTQSTGPYVRPDGVPVADDWIDLTDGSLRRPINADEFGNPLTSSVFVWTGTGTDGTASGDNCFGWITDNTAASGQGGQMDETGSQWTEDIPLFCSISARLYCFEQ